jgi:hypothetical protein
MDAHTTIQSKDGSSTDCTHLAVVAADRKALSRTADEVARSMVHGVRRAGCTGTAQRRQTNGSEENDAAPAGLEDQEDGDGDLRVRKVRRGGHPEGRIHRLERPSSRTYCHAGKPGAC